MKHVAQLLPHCLLTAQRTRRWWTVAVLLLLLPLAGCGKDDIGLQPAYGTVTLDGEPLAGAQLIFESESQGPVTGRTDDNGYYEMEFSASRKGAFQGMNTVRISTNVIFEDADIPEDVLEGDADEIEAAGYLPKERVPPKYNTESQLTVEVKRGGAPYDFDLTSQ